MELRMNTKETITRAYDLAADSYAANFWNEFEKKHFDRILLPWYGAQVPPGQRVLEIGCGPGEVSGFLNRCGVQCIGTDISARMIENARRYYPDVSFEVQDFFNLGYADGAFFGVVAYYAIVNLTLAEIREVFAEVQRVLQCGGLFLFTFHVYEHEERTDVQRFFSEQGGPLTFYYFKVDEMKALVESLGFQVVDILVRYPYPEVEYPSKRSYFLLQKSAEAGIG
jgi:ubiquinone/menaquinone biosynthesis C-methylase UbiE